MKVKIIFMASSLTLLVDNAVAESDLRFNPAFINGEVDNNVDLSWIGSGNEIPPGHYNVNIYINDNFAFTADIPFAMREGVVSPQFSKEQLSALGIDLKQLADANAFQQQQAGLWSLEDILPQATFSFINKTMTLQVNVPQRYMVNLPRGYVNPESWDYGLTSGWVNYVINGSRDDAQAPEQLFIGLSSALNWGAWRLRDYSTWTKSQADGFSHGRTWLQRDLKALDSQLSVGEVLSSQKLFDSVGMRGIMLNSDDNMLPDSLRGYAPEVKGIAKSHATVTVRQNNNILYQTTVSPGPFILKDLYPTAFGGDLDVTIEEENGQNQHFTVPFASVPDMLRRGQVHYAVGAGKYQAAGNQNEPQLFWGEAYWGAFDNLTLYGGTQLTLDYRAVAIGAGQNLGIVGAYAVDLTHARSRLADGHLYSGNSVQVRYSKLLNYYGTRLNFYSWRYSTAGFYSLSDTTWRAMKSGAPPQTTNSDGTVTYQYDNYYDLNRAKKAKNQLEISQQMGDLGSLSLSWVRQTWWKSNQTSESTQFAWNSTWRRLSFGLSYQRSTSLGSGKKENILSLAVSVPLGSPAAATRANFSVLQPSASPAVYNLGISGYMPGNKSLFYSASQRINSQNENGGNLALQYSTGKGDYNLGYGYSPQSRNISYGASGGIVLHEGGVTLSRPLGNTNILVKAPGAEGAALRNNPNVTTDSHGYAVIPWASPYRQNRVEMDVTTAGQNVEIENAIVNVVPTEGALVRAEIKTQTGLKAMFFIRHDRSDLPFGSLASISQRQQNSGIVGDNGSLYMSGLAESGTLKIVWGKGADKQCQASYYLKPQHFNPATGLYTQELNCQ
ncbi:fimbria/pilus outer membrane usher protein [Scandinavium sp.]|uniref:fimbria/pilus outer membrane usher protein n=1 Tax=Scandinavium sp. TaxID=2830653 RepID=UPI00289FFCA9|nr:fimbria/pilus outer membrane usher protein [Scandinavium sp.]